MGSQPIHVYLNLGVCFPGLNGGCQGEGGNKKTRGRKTGWARLGGFMAEVVLCFHERHSCFAVWGSGSVFQNSLGPVTPNLGPAGLAVGSLGHGYLPCCPPCATGLQALGCAWGFSTALLFQASLSQALASPSCENSVTPQLRSHLLQEVCPERPRSLWAFSLFSAPAPPSTLYFWSVSQLSCELLGDKNGA